MKMVESKYKNPDKFIDKLKSENEWLRERIKAEEENVVGWVPEKDVSFVRGGMKLCAALEPGENINIMGTIKDIGAAVDDSGHITSSITVTLKCLYKKRGW